MKKILTISTVLFGVVFLAGCGQKPVSQITQPTTPVPATQQFATLSVDETASWQTYSNKKLGFEFKYPNRWTASDMKFEDGDKYASMTLHNPTGGSTWIAFYPTLQDVRNIKAGQSLEQYLMQKDETIFSDINAFESLGQKWWFALEAGSAGYDRTVFAEHNGHVYQIVFESGPEYNSPDKMPAVEKGLVNNFKFTN